MSRNSHDFYLDEDERFSDLFTGKLNIGIVFGVGFLVATIIMAPKAAVGLLIVFAIMGGARLWQEPQRLNVFLAVPGLLLVMLFLAFAIWTTLSTGWHFAEKGEPERALHLAGLFVIGFAALMAPVPTDRNLRRVIGYGFCIGYIFSCALIVAAMLYVMTGHEVFWGSYYDDPLSTLNSRAVIVALLFWPVLLVLRHARRAWQVFLFIGVLGILAFTSSLASFVSVLIGGIGMAFRYFGGRVAVIGLVMLVAVATVCAPYGLRAINADSFASSKMVMDDTQLLPASARHRLAIWSFAVDRIYEKPLLGWGFDSSRSIPQEQARLSANMEILPLHPHSLALQTRLELGLPGVMLLAIILVLVLMRTANWSDDRKQAGIALAVALGWLFIANVSYGMWQSWWIATAFLLVILMRQVIAEPASEAPKTADSPGS